MFPIGLAVWLMIYSYKPDDFIQTLKHRLFSYSQEKPQFNLYLHLDKSIYKPNESIWFKAYIRTTSTLANEVLYLRLVDQAKKIVLEKKFPVYDIRSHGDILLPDTLREGDYFLYAYTDRMINFDPKDIFVQQIAVIRNSVGLLRLNVAVSDPMGPESAKENVQVVCNLSRNNVPVIHAKGSYRLVTSDNDLIEEGTLKTSESGLAIINLTNTKINTKEGTSLFIVFKQGGETATESLELTDLRTKTVINVSSEGGTLIDGLSARMLIETTSQNGFPITANVSLLKDSKIINTTTTNQNGVGYLSVIPDKNARYSFLIDQKELISFPLKIEENGWDLKLKNDGKQSLIVLHNRGMPPQAQIVVRSVNSIVWNKVINTESGDSSVVTLPLSNHIKQLYNVALFTSSGKLVAERLFLNKRENNYNVQLIVNKAAYKPREKVNVKLLITDSAGSPVAANLSVAVILKTTIDSITYKTIYQSEYSSLNTGNKKYRFDDTDNRINDYFIGKSWYKNDWWSVLNYIPKGNLKIISNTGGVFGMIKPKKGNLKEMKELFLYSKNGLRAIPVFPNGVFSISPADLVGKRNEKKYLILTPEFLKKYTVHINDYAGEYDRNILLNKDFFVRRFVQIKKPEKTFDLQGKNILQEVVIKKKANPSNTSVKPFYSFTCADYICFYNILNCTNHKGGSPPVDGEVYVYNDGRPVVYHECKKNAPVGDKNLLLKNVILPEDFYLPDYTLQPLTSPELQSTVYWNPNLDIRRDKEQAFEFYTSDVKGVFSIIVQGLESNTLKPIFYKKDFNVD